MKNKRRLILMISSMLVLLMVAGLFGSSDKSLVEAFSGTDTNKVTPPPGISSTPQATTTNTVPPTSVTPGIGQTTGTPFPTIGGEQPNFSATPVPTMTPEASNTPSPTPTEIPEYYESNVIIIKVNTLNVRNDASTSSAITGKIYFGNYATVVEDCGDWYKINSGSIKNQYVYKKYTYSGYEAAAYVDEQKGAEAVIKRTTNVRQGPSISEDYTKVASKGDKFILCLTRSTEDWLCVELDSDNYGYIKASDVTISFNLTAGLTTAEIKKMLEDKEKESFQYKLRAAFNSDKYLDPEKSLPITNRLTNGSLSGSRYDFFKNYTMSSQERDFFAATLLQEVGWHPYEGKLAAATVIVNRLLNGGYGNTITAVLSSPYQFSGANPFMTNWKVDSKKLSTFISTTRYKDRLNECYQIVDAVMSGATNLPADFYYFQSKASAESKSRGYPVLHFNKFTFIGNTYFHNNWYSQ